METKCPVGKEGAIWREEEKDGVECASLAGGRRKRRENLGI